jgi:hypothetical protein
MRATHTPAEQSRLARTNDRSSAPLWQSRISIVAVGVGDVNLSAGQHDFWAKNL